MGYEKLGRKLGIGTRVAAKMLRERGQRIPSPPKTVAAKAPPRPAAKLFNPRTAARNTARGSREFGRSFWKPLKKAIRGLWHEVTGVFFAIFATFFVQSAWRIRSDWETGPHHHRFIVYLIFALIFAYFSVTAFVHSRRSPR